MLDLSRLAAQMQGMGQQLTQEAEAARRRGERARRVLMEMRSRQDDWVALLDQWRDRLSFVAAEPIEPLDTRVMIEAPPLAHTVLATDGSQISPSHHEIAYCYLINTGRVVLHYGQGRYPLLDSVPEVVYRPEDLYVSRQWGISTEDWMGYRRTVSEAEVLAELAIAVAAERSRPNSANSSAATLKASSKNAANKTSLKTSKKATKSEPLPLLAMVDGSLIYWFLETLPAAARDRILPPILAAWDRLRLTGVPMMGYLSASRSGEALNFLRLHGCKFSEPDCPNHCPNRSDDAPCNGLRPLRDAALWEGLLQPGERGPLWRSSARILGDYGLHGVYFCYVHVGSEVARIEVPEWLVRDRALLDRALGIMIAQVQKGQGYPVALAEAHNQAVVRGGDRARFFLLLEREMTKAGLRNVGTSYKEARKRGSIA
ncbi:MAG: DNA double-strand break repair nuclease NurA [Cyanophyceae cyanobacterium]